jgi:hypothetical protein
MLAIKIIAWVAFVVFVLVFNYRANCSETKEILNEANKQL